MRAVAYHGTRDGHEPMGIVEEVGSDVKQIKPGDRVVIPFNISCGPCFMCDQQLYSQCETTQVGEQGKRASLFGYTKLYGQVPGGRPSFCAFPRLISVRSRFRRGRRMSGSCTCPMSSRPPGRRWSTPRYRRKGRSRRSAWGRSDRCRVESRCTVPHASIGGSSRRDNLVERGLWGDGRPDADDGPVRHADPAPDGAGECQAVDRRDHATARG